MLHTNTQKHRTSCVSVCSFISTEEDEVKRKNILKKLKAAGYTFREGGDPTKAFDGDGVYRTVISRHREINELLVGSIEKQSGVKLG